MTNREHVDTLLAMYEEYKQLHRTEAEFLTQLAKAKVLGINTDELAKKYLAAKEAVQKISDAMTFTNPIVWILYKFEAYAIDPQAIRTLQDFRIHCSKRDYICTKRFTFINQQLEQKGLPTLSDPSRSEQQSLDDLASAPEIVALVDDPEFQHKWDAYEYFKQDNQIKKWENFIPA